MKPVDEAMFLGAAGLFVVFYFNDAAQDLLMLQLIVAILILLTILTLVVATLRGAPFDTIISSSGATILGVLYVVLLGSHVVALRTGFPQQLSAHLLSFLFLVVMGSDAGAYYLGRTFGKHKMAPKISPGKTWEGFVGGFLAGVLLAVVSHFWFFKNLPLKWALGLGALMTGLGMLGDLTESALKRSVGAKDAANLLPGHGGMLDRLDSLLFNAPLIYYFARIYFP